MKRKTPFVWRRCFGAFAVTVLAVGLPSSLVVIAHLSCKQRHDPWQPPPLKGGTEGLKLTPLDGRDYMRVLYVRLRLRADTVADDMVGLLQEWGS